MNKIAPGRFELPSEPPKGPMLSVFPNRIREFDRYTTGL